MKKLVICVMIFLSTFFLDSCAQLSLNRTEIDRIFNTRIIGIDKQPDGKVRMTITTKSTSTNSSAQGGGSTTEYSDILVSEGETVFDAARKFMAYANKKPHYGHTEFILFGEDTARDGILPFLDFVSRNHEFRYNAKIYIVQNDTAYNVINKLNIGDMFLADKLSMMEDNAPNLSESSKETLSEAMYIFDKQNISTYVPSIQIVDAIPTNDSHTTSQRFNLELKGYGIFKKDKLVDFVSGRLSRGINWIRKKVKSGIILVDTPDGKKVTMEIISSKTIIKPKIEKNALTCDIIVHFTTNLGETMSKSDLFNEDALEALEREQEKIVKEEVEDTIRYAQERNLDIFGTVTNFVMAYPPMKKELRQNWNKLFPEVQFNVEVASNINRTYLLKEPTGSNKKR